MEKSFQYNNTHIHYTIQGSGQPIVLLYGFGEDSTVWQEQAFFLQAYATVITPDLPGSGHSALLQQDNVGMSDYAVCIHALLQHENISRCILLGHSMGGYITLAYAEMYPAYLQGFGFINSTAFADTEEKKASRQQGIQMMEEYGAFAFLKNAIPTLFAKAYKAQHSDKIAALVEKGKQFTTAALVQYYTAMMDRPDRTHVLRAAQVPVLFTLGTADIAAPLQDLLQQVHLPNSSHIHILEDIGHMSMMEAADKVNNHILEFLNL